MLISKRGKENVKNRGLLKNSETIKKKTNMLKESTKPKKLKKTKIKEAKMCPLPLLKAPHLPIHSKCGEDLGGQQGPKSCSRGWFKSTS